MEFQRKAQLVDLGFVRFLPRTGIRRACAMPSHITPIGCTNVSVQPTASSHASCWGVYSLGLAGVSRSQDCHNTDKVASVACYIAAGASSPSELSLEHLAGQQDISGTCFFPSAATDRQLLLQSYWHCASM